MVLDKLFSRIIEEIPGYMAAAAGSLTAVDNFHTHSNGPINLSESRAPLLAMIQGYVDTYEALGGAIDLGSNDEILVTASRIYLLIKIDHDHQRFIAVVLSSSGNIGYLRFRIREYLRQVAFD